MHSLTCEWCSRSSTGVGEYYFKTAQSVQITHAIETVVKKLKYEALGSNQQVSPPAPTGMYHVMGFLCSVWARMLMYV